LLVEPGLSASTLQGLVARGHKVVIGRIGTSANSILVSPDGPIGAADTRARASVAVGN
jgi:gamma-glutamyltranspeptidase / glutathione hydrolase